MQNEYGQRRHNSNCQKIPQVQDGLKYREPGKGMQNIANQVSGRARQRSQEGTLISFSHLTTRRTSLFQGTLYTLERKGAVGCSVYQDINYAVLNFSQSRHNVKVKLFRSRYPIRAIITLLNFALTFASPMADTSHHAQVNFRSVIAFFDKIVRGRITLFSHTRIREEFDIRQKVRICQLVGSS